MGRQLLEPLGRFRAFAVFVFHFLAPKGVDPPMDKNNSRQNEESQQIGGFSRKNVENGTQENAGDANNAEDIPEDDVDKVERFMRGIAIEWRKVDFFKRFDLSISVIGIVVLCIYTTYTACMYSANEKAAEAAESAATTAEETLKHSIKAYQVDERAWVSILDIEPKDQGNLVIKIVLINTGKTPARDFTVAAAGDVGRGKSSEKELLGRGIIAPGGKFSSFMQANGSLTNSTKLTIHGRVDYSSVFGGRHWTTFCYYLVHENAGTPNGFAPCESGNNTDDNRAQ
jgi:hypothetical protein